MKQYSLIAIIALFSIGLASSAFSKDLTWKGRTIGSIGQVEIVDDDSGDPARLFLRVTTQLDHTLLSQLDNYLMGQGDFEKDHWSQRLYWVGGTSVLNAGNALRLSSRARYEKWARAWFAKTRLLQDTKTIHWELFVKPATINNLSVSARLVNIKNFPGFLEKWLGLRIQGDINIPLPTDCGPCKCSELVNKLKPKMESASFTQVNGAIRLNTMFSGKKDLAGVLECFIRR